MTAADRARGTAAKFAAHPSPAEPAPAGDVDAELEGAAAEARTARTARTKRVRKTVDITIGAQRTFVTWLDDAAVQLDVARVNTQDALEALVHLLNTDEATSRKVLAELKRTLGGAG